MDKDTNKEIIKLLIDYDYKFEKNNEYTTYFNKLIAVNKGNYRQYGKVYVEVGSKAISRVYFRILSDVVIDKIELELSNNLLNEFSKELEKLKPYFEKWYSVWE